MKPRTLALLAACCIALALPLRATDLAEIIAAASKYESGQSVEPLRQIEQLLRDAKPAQRAELEAALAKLLAPTATFEAKRFGCQQLGAFGTDASLPAVAELLKNEETVGIACLALSAQRSPKAVEVLRNALSAASGKARLQLISAIGNHQDTASVTQLVALTRDADTFVSEAAIVALSKISAEPAREAIAALRKSPGSANTRVIAGASLRVAENLAAAGDRKSAAAIYEEMLQPAQPKSVRRGAFNALVRLDKDGGEQRILDTLHSSDALLKPVAIAAVRLLKSAGTSKKFSAEMSALSSGEQVLMIEALAARGDAGARVAIEPKVSAPDAAVRAAAIAAVGKLGDASSVPLLAKALAATSDAAERQQIEQAFSSLPAGRVTDKAVIAELKKASTDVKANLISILSKRNSATAVPALFEETQSANADVARAAFQALGRLAAAEDLPALLARLTKLQSAELRPAAESAAARAIVRIDDPARRSDPVCAALAKAGDVEARCSLVRLLPSCASPAAFAALKPALESADAPVREAAVRALADWPDATAWDSLAAIYRQPANESNRALALRAMVRLASDENAHPSAALIARYRQLLDGARNDDERKLVLGALSGATQPEALPLALSLFSNPAVRAEAALAVRKIAAAIKDKHPQEAQQALQQLKPKPAAKK